MAISGLAGIVRSGVSLCSTPEPEQIKQDSRPLADKKVCTADRALSIVDTLLGVAAIVVGILMLMKICPLIPGVGVAFAYGAIGFGVANLIASLRGGYTATRDALADCCADDGKPKKA